MTQGGTLPPPTPTASCPQPRPYARHTRSLTSSMWPLAPSSGIACELPSHRHPWKPGASVWALQRCWVVPTCLRASAFHHKENKCLCIAFKPSLGPFSHSLAFSLGHLTVPCLPLGTGRRPPTSTTHSTRVTQRSTRVCMWGADVQTLFFFWSYSEALLGRRGRLDS